MAVQPQMYFLEENKRPLTGNQKFPMIVGHAKDGKGHLFERVSKLSGAEKYECVSPNCSKSFRVTKHDSWGGVFQTKDDFRTGHKDNHEGIFEYYFLVNGDVSDFKKSKAPSTLKTESSKRVKRDQPTAQGPSSSHLQTTPSTIENNCEALANLSVNKGSKKTVRTRSVKEVTETTEEE